MLKALGHSSHEDPGRERYLYFFETLCCQNSLTFFGTPYQEIQIWTLDRLIYIYFSLVVFKAYSAYFCGNIYIIFSLVQFICRRFWPQLQRQSFYLHCCPESIILFQLFKDDMDVVVVVQDASQRRRQVLRSDWAVLFQHGYQVAVIIPISYYRLLTLHFIRMVYPAGILLLIKLR